MSEVSSEDASNLDKMLLYLKMAAITGALGVLAWVLPKLAGGVA